MSKNANTKNVNKTSVNALLKAREDLRKETAIFKKDLEALETEKDLKETDIHKLTDGKTLKDYEDVPAYKKALEDLINVNGRIEARKNVWIEKRKELNALKRTALDGLISNEAYKFGYLAKISGKDGFITIGKKQVTIPQEALSYEDYLKEALTALGFGRMYVKGNKPFEHFMETMKREEISKDNRVLFMGMNAYKFKEFFGLSIVRYLLENGYTNDKGEKVIYTFNKTYTGLKTEIVKD